MKIDVQRFFFKIDIIKKHRMCPAFMFSKPVRFELKTDAV